MTTHDVYLLKLKQDLKKLDPKFFNSEERKAFDASDKSEWHQWIKNVTVRTVPKQKEHLVDESKTIAAPMRFVRTNKGRLGEALIGKCRLVLPGHRDPQIGWYRTDAPTTSPLAVYVAAVITLSMGWIGMLFDVSIAFLTGKKLDREVYACGPKEGLPAVEGAEAVLPSSLLQVLKGACNLTDALRWWYLRAHDLLIAIGFIELKCCRAVFVLWEKTKWWQF